MVIRNRGRKGGKKMIRGLRERNMENTCAPNLLDIENTRASNLLDLHDVIIMRIIQDLPFHVAKICANSCVVLRIPMTALRDAGFWKVIASCGGGVPSRPALPGFTVFVNQCSGIAYFFQINVETQLLKPQFILGAAASEKLIMMWSATGEVHMYSVKRKNNEYAVFHENMLCGRDRFLGTKVAGVSCGCDHIVIWSQTGEVFTLAYHCSNLLYGQTGQGNMVPSMPCLLKLRHVIIGAAAGDDHTILWSQEGKVLTFGFGKHGQLGHGNTNHQFVPKMMEAPSLDGKKIVGAAAGCMHSLLLTNQGEIFSFGTGAFGQLGLGSMSVSTPVPIHVHIASKTRVLSVAAGPYHTIMTTERGHVFTFGYGKHGQLGLGTTSHKFEPTLVHTLCHWNICHVAAGAEHCVATTMFGDTFMFGKLGNGNSDIELEPVQTNLSLLV